MKVAIMTDSNSGISVSEGKKLGIFVLPMPFFVDEKMYLEGVSLSRHDFFKFLREDKEVHTSQPAPADITAMWDEILEEYESIVYIPMTSGLSNSCQTATVLSMQEDYESRVFVADNRRISVSQRQSCFDAVKLAKKGKDAEYIKKFLEQTACDSSIYLAIDNMKYLKKGGRVTPAAAGIATVLGIKPVLRILDENIDSFSKARGMDAAKKIMIESVKKDLKGRLKSCYDMGKISLGIAYAGKKVDIDKVEDELEKEFPGMKILRNPLSLSICCHTGEGALGIGCFRAE